MSAGPDAAAHAADALIELFTVFTGAKVVAELFARLRQPAVVGEILAGVLLGPYVLHWVAPSEALTLLAELGIVFLLFGVGLETAPKAILAVGKIAAIVAVLGVILPFAAGFALLKGYGASGIESAFAGTALVATSVGITAKVLGEMGLLEARTARIILGAAVIDDVLGLLTLATVSSAAEGDVDLLRIAGMAVLAIGFVVLVAVVGSPAVKRLAPKLDQSHSGNMFFLFAIALCLGLAVAAAQIGVAAIIGAFLAGMALAESAAKRHDVHQQVRGVGELLTPFFLVNIGLQLKLDVFSDLPTVELAAALTVVAVLTKLIGCGLGAASLGWRGAAQVGVGMVPRGEVGIVVAQLGLGLGIIHENLFGAVLVMAVGTTLIAPPLIRPLFADVD